jgi:type II secretory pathway pseudopilin PulG
MMPPRDRRPGGYTLMELMMIVTVIGILLLISVPKLGTIIRKSNEGSTKANLGALRSALHIYYSDMGGIYPSDLNSLTASAKYLQQLPKAKTPDYHPFTAAAVTQVSSNDMSGWSYNGTPTDANIGVVWVNCTHTDVKGGVWTTY